MPDNIKSYLVAFIIAFVALGLFIILLSILYSRRQAKNKNEKIKMQSQFQQELLQTQLEIQEQTLKTISQEIHDNVGQVLSLAKLNLNTFENTESAFNQTRINDTKQLVSKAINDLRDLSRSLHGDRIGDLGFHEAIANELKILRNTGQCETSLKITGQAYKLEPQKEMVLFRIFQEAFHNAVKHARAKSIVVQMLYESDEFKLMIIDDGVGFERDALKAHQAGIGLKSMQNRATLIGGVLFITSTVGHGTVVTIEMKKS